MTKSEKRLLLWFLANSKTGYARKASTRALNIDVHTFSLLVGYLEKKGYLRRLSGIHQQWERGKFELTGKGLVEARNLVRDCEKVKKQAKKAIKKGV